MTSADPRLDLIHLPSSEVIAGPLADRALKANEQVPSFTLPDGSGDEYSLKLLTQRGAVLLAFYHGVWCPLCNVELRGLQAGLLTAHERHTSVVAISMQNAANSRETAAANALSFPVLYDFGGAVSAQFGLLYKLPRTSVDSFRESLGVDLSHFNGEGSWSLPMVARYVVGTDGVVAYAEINRAFNAHGCIGELLPILDRLAARSGRYSK